MTSDEKRKLAARLRGEGFKTSYDKDSLGVRVTCSQCQAMVIQGVAVHERGCPNEKR